MSFASTDDLATLLGTSFTDGQLAQAQLALDIATAAIRSYTRQQITTVTGDEIILDPENRKLILLPEIPVVDVSEVIVGDDTLTIADDVFWYADGRLYRTSGGSWGTARQSVEVTYDHGYAEVPDSVRGVCLAKASRLLANPESLRQESIGSYSRTYEGGSSGLTEDEEMILDEYRIRGLA